MFKRKSGWLSQEMSSETESWSSGAYTRKKWEDWHQMKLLQAYHQHEIIGFDSIGL